MTVGSLEVLGLVSGANGPELTERNRRKVVAHLNHKAATAASIEALAMRAIETGNTESLEDLAMMATVLSEDLRRLAVAVGELVAA